MAVILYDARPRLELGKLRGHTRRAVIRLITWGVTITWAFAAAFAALLRSAVPGPGQRHPGAGHPEVPPLEEGDTMILLSPATAGS